MSCFDWLFFKHFVARDIHTWVEWFRAWMDKCFRNILCWERKKQHFSMVLFAVFREVLHHTAFGKSFQFQFSLSEIKTHFFILFLSLLLITLKSLNRYVLADIGCQQEKKKKTIIEHVNSHDDFFFSMVEKLSLKLNHCL